MYLSVWVNQLHPVAANVGPAGPLLAKVFLKSWKWPKCSILQVIALPRGRKTSAGTSKLKSVILSWHLAQLMRSRQNSISHCPRVKNFNRPKLSFIWLFLAFIQRFIALAYGWNIRQVTVSFLFTSRWKAPGFCNLLYFWPLNSPHAIEGYARQDAFTSHVSNGKYNPVGFISVPPFPVGRNQEKQAGSCAAMTCKFAEC